MKFYRSYLGVLGATLAGWPTAYALQWTSVEAVLRPQPDGTMPMASYGFRNDTSTPVTITQAVPSCDCTTIDLAKKTYAPGERGTLVARFDPTGRYGVVRRTLQITTDEPNLAPQVLQLTAILPEVLTFTPTELHWPAGSQAPTPQTVDVHIHTPNGIDLVAAWANQPDFKVELTTVQSPTHYRVTVTPPILATPQQALVLLRPNGPIPAGTNLTLNLRVK